MASAMREKNANRRIRLLLVVFTVAFLAMFARAFWLQGVKAAHLSQLAKSQHEETQTIPAGRGTIFDRTGVQLAIGEQTTTVYADPAEVRNPRGIALAAHEILGVDGDTLYPELLNKKSQFVYVARFADPAKAGLFLKKGFIGVLSYPEELRTYPQNGVAAQVLGYAGVDDHGLGGLELQYDHKLAGHTGTQTIVRDPTGRAIDVISSKPVQEGANVFTTLDHTIQAQAERVLNQTVSQWGAKDATAVVLDPTTGEVLAMAQTPGYNANSTSNVARYSPGLLRNRAVTDTYEPGLDLQAGHGHRGALGSSRHAEHALHAPVRVPVRPLRAVQRARRRGARHGQLLRGADPLVLLECGSRDDRREARPEAARRLGEEVRLRLGRPASTSRARAVGRCSRSPTGARPRSATSRSARESR